MGDLSTAGPQQIDEHFLRRSFDIARRAMTHGNHPFGAILVDGIARAAGGRERLHAGA